MKEKKKYTEILLSHSSVPIATISYSSTGRKESCSSVGTLKNNHLLKKLKI